MHIRTRKLFYRFIFQKLRLQIVGVKNIQNEEQKIFKNSKMNNFFNLRSYNQKLLKNYNEVCDIWSNVDFFKNGKMKGRQNIYQCSKGESYVIAKFLWGVLG